MAIQAIVLGNVAFDVICATVDDVPRYDSLVFEQGLLAPGGCGSNTAIGLAAQGIRTALVASIGADSAGDMAISYWQRIGVDQRWVRRVPDGKTGISVCLIDSQAQPRFVHTHGSNAKLTVDNVPWPDILKAKPAVFHVAGHFLIPGLHSPALAEPLGQLQEQGCATTLDVALSARMANPEPLWAILPKLDVFMCNLVEANRLTGQSDPQTAADFLLSKGTKHVIIKLGSQGCLLKTSQDSRIIPGMSCIVVDTTGAGDAFAAGLIAGLVQQQEVATACVTAHQAASRVVSSLGAVEAWFSPNYHP